MIEKMGGSYFSQAEAEQPLGFYAVNIYGDGSIASQAEPPSIHQLFQAQQSQEKQRDSDVEAREEVREWEYRIKLALQIGRGAVLASIVGSMVAGCVPGREGSLPVTMASDNATGYAPDVSLISSIPTLDIMPSISPSPRIFPSNTLSIMSSPTEIAPFQISTKTETSTMTLTPSPTETPKPTATKEPLVPPTPEEGVRVVLCNIKIMRQRLEILNNARKTFRLPVSGRVIPIEKVNIGLYPKTNGNCTGKSVYLEPEFTGVIQDVVIRQPDVEVNADPNETTGGEYGDIMRKCKKTAKSLFELFPTSMRLAYDKMLELVYNKAKKQCEWKLNDNPDYVAPTPTKTLRPTWTQESTQTP